MRQTPVNVVAAATAGVNHDSRCDLHEPREDERALRSGKRRLTHEPENGAHVLSLPGVDVSRLMERLVGATRRMRTEERAFRSSGVGIRGMAGVTANVVSPIHGIVMLVHVDVGLDRFHYAGAPDMQRLSSLLLFLVDVLRLQYSLFELFRFLGDQVGVFSGNTRSAVVPVENDIVPHSLEGKALLAPSDRADIRHQTHNKRQEIHGRQRHGTSEEEIALGTVLAAFVPVTPSRSATLWR